MKGVTVRVRVGHYENFELQIRSVDKLGGARLLIIVKPPPPSRARINLNRRNCACTWVKFERLKCRT